ncbi:MAG: lytic transglycosylase domain-containing protein [Elusimicrobiota bacterium]|jgi:soluble lytic murein transglycosylase-like protein
MTPLSLALAALIGFSSAPLMATPPASFGQQAGALSVRKQKLGADITAALTELRKHGPAIEARHLPGLMDVLKKSQAAVTAEDVGYAELSLEAWRSGLLSDLYPSLAPVFGGRGGMLPKGGASVSERLKAGFGDVSEMSRIFDNSVRARASADAVEAPALPAAAASDPLTSERSRFSEVEKLLRARGASQRVIDLTIGEALRQGADPLLVLAMVQAESNFKPGAVSHCGARGLMQLMPATAKDMGVSDPDALFDPRTNVRAGVKYLKWLWGKFAKQSFSDLFKSEFNANALAQKSVAAYNAGPGNVAKFNGIPPFKETRKYVARIVAAYDSFKTAFLAAFVA